MIEDVSPPLDSMTQQLLLNVEKMQKALREARIGTGNLKVPDEKAKSELRVLEGRMEGYARRLRGGSSAQGLSNAIRVQITGARALLLDYIPPEKLTRILGTDKVW